MKRLATTLLVSLTLGLGLASTANASPVIAFDDNDAHSGIISYAGTGGALSGKDIFLDTITGINTGADGNYICESCLLNFTTGNYLSPVPNTTYSSLFGAGGIITVTGTMRDHKYNVVATGTLATGSFTDAVIATVVPGTVSITMGVGIDEKHDGLEKFFKIFNNPTWNFGLTVIAAQDVTTGANGLFSATVTNADFDNTTVVPLPAAVWMFGSALMGFLALSRNKKA